MKLPRYTRRLASLLLVGIITSYWGFTGDSDLTQSSLQTQADQIDTYIHGAEIRQFDRRGELSRQLQARKIEHHTLSASSHFTQPRLTLQRPQGSPLLITAREAVSSDNNQLIELRREVEITPQTDQPTRFSTEQLFFEPAVNFAWTGEPVAYYRGTNTTLATGMNAYFNQDRVELLNRVRGHYEPN
ncbi:MAG TPA: LPS export ABC transporter periplasmic protein LptC [Motiliproteus sp.]